MHPVFSTDLADANSIHREAHRMSSDGSWLTSEIVHSEPPCTLDA